MFIVFFIQRLFVASILKQIYQVKNLPADSGETRTKNTRRVVPATLPTTTTSITSDTFRLALANGGGSDVNTTMNMGGGTAVAEGPPHSSMASVMDASGGVRGQPNIGEKLRKKLRISEEDQNTVLLNIINRIRFIYTLKDILSYFIRCICLRKGHSYKKHKTFNKGEKKLAEELDVVSILRSMRQIKLLT